MRIFLLLMLLMTPPLQAANMEPAPRKPIPLELKEFDEIDWPDIDFRWFPGLPGGPVKPGEQYRLEYTKLSPGALFYHLRRVGRSDNGGHSLCFKAVWGWNPDNVTMHVTLHYRVQKR